MTDISDRVGKRACEIANEKGVQGGTPHSWPDCGKSDCPEVAIAIAALMETPPEPPKDERVEAMKSATAVASDKWQLNRTLDLHELYAEEFDRRIGLFATRGEWEKRNG